MSDRDRGLKLDAGKLDYSLEDEAAVAEKVAVLTYGAVKYDRGNYLLVPDLGDRYYAALRRHLQAFRGGERLDPETGLHHLAHAMCCVEFLLAADLRTPEGEEIVRSQPERLDGALEVARRIRAQRATVAQAGVSEPEATNGPSIDQAASGGLLTPKEPRVVISATRAPGPWSLK